MIGIADKAPYAKVRPELWDVCVKTLKKLLFFGSNLAVFLMSDRERGKLCQPLGMVSGEDASRGPRTVAQAVTANYAGRQIMPYEK